jgi:tetratricopeptide (TPR) repeat protein
MRFITVFLLCVISATSLAQEINLPPPSEVKPDPEQAKKHFQNAKIFYELGQFKEAIYEYNLAYMSEQRAEFLYNLAQAYWRLGEVQGNLEAMRMARFHFGLFLKKDPTSIYKKKIEGMLKELSKEIKRAEEKQAEAEERRRFRVRDERLLQEVTPGKASDETLQMIMGLDYTPFIKSGLTLEGYLEIKRGKRNSKLGIMFIGSGLLLGVTGALLHYNDDVADKPGVLILGASGVAIGGVSLASGSFLLSYGLIQQRSGKLEKRAKPSEPASQSAN